MKPLSIIILLSCLSISCKKEDKNPDNITKTDFRKKYEGNYNVVYTMRDVMDHADYPALNYVHNDTFLLKLTISYSDLDSIFPYSPYGGGMLDNKAALTFTFDKLPQEKWGIDNAGLLFRTLTPGRYHEGGFINDSTIHYEGGGYVTHNQHQYFTLRGKKIP
jgi:hypothetical protein